MHSVVAKAVTQLSKTRPIFHNENDLRHALAQTLAKANPQLDVSVDAPSEADGKRKHDILLTQGSRSHVVELRYPMHALLYRTPSGEIFDLRTGARDIARHFIVGDVQTVERYVAIDRASRSGSVVAISNDKLLWEGSRPGTICAAFSLKEGRKIPANTVLDWAPHAGKGSIDNCPEPVLLEDYVDVRWQAYSNVGGATFKALVIERTGNRASPSMAEETKRFHTLLLENASQLQDAEFLSELNALRQSLKGLGL